MAAPLFETAGTHLQGGTRSSIAVDAPAGVATNDIILVGFFHDEATNQTITPPSGFTAAPNMPINAANHRLHLYWKRASGDGTDDDTDTYTFSWTTAVYCEARALRISGCITTGNPFETDTGTAFDNVSDTISPDVSTTTDAADRLIIHGATNWAGGTWTAHTGYTKQVQGTDGLFTICTKSQAAAGSTGTVNATCSGTDKMTAFIGSLTPVASGDTPISGSDSATESETSSVAITASVTDTGTLTETAQIGTSSTDPAATSETSSLSATVTGSDSYTLTDSSSLESTTQDSGTTTETASLTVTITASDTASVTDSGSLDVGDTPISGSDSATLTEANALQRESTVTDTQILTEAASITVQITASDAITAAEAAALSGTLTVSDVLALAEVGSLDTGAAAKATSTPTVTAPNTSTTAVTQPNTSTAAVSTAATSASTVT